MTAVMFPCAAEGRNWLIALRRYLALAAAAHLFWEFAHLPLYTIWLTGTAGELVFAAVHCTGGDILITRSALVLALLLFAASGWPQARAGRVLAAAILFGVGYTIFSEWLNIDVRGAWAYREMMPVIPLIDAGLSPIMQWVVVPLAAYAYAIGWQPWRRAAGEAAHG
ncbi:hypothetical protein DDZ14_16675 [Maritimibacter sp. 55A14]|uniref:hypothetical protein n=1 Tax=Maritimibacter sp. 55A14 TaxID=2174844 RepID=UPI000D6081D1|nr:hypothetical protein [Maritimibacter sp. 55A14]PWE29862.1 hypothetical protein DDZ14_16675 [Maritimibacter sp. 55A14]